MAITRALIMWYVKLGSSCEATASHPCPSAHWLTPTCPGCKHINKNLAHCCARGILLSLFCFPRLNHKVTSFFPFVTTPSLAFPLLGNFPGALDECREWNTKKVASKQEGQLNLIKENCMMSLSLYINIVYSRYKYSGMGLVWVTSFRCRFKRWDD